MKYKGIIISTMMIGIINFIYSEGVKIEKITVISKEILSL